MKCRLMYRDSANNWKESAVRYVDEVGEAHGLTENQIRAAESALQAGRNYISRKGFMLAPASC